MVLTQLSDLPAWLVDRQAPAFRPWGLGFPGEHVRHEDFETVASFAVL
jgi:hypothetical protein